MASHAAAPAALRFGTDGVRGAANVELTPEVVTALGRAVAGVLDTDRPFVLGRDTRRSGPMLEAALAAGLAGAGADVVLAGVLPTPGVAFLAADLDAPALVVTASHNPATDNGVKVFARGGRKLDDAAETAIETAWHAAGSSRATVGTITSLVGAMARYIVHLAAALEGRRVAPLRVVVDCAHGAASESAPSALREVGADVIVRHAEPNGDNINADAGSTSPDELRRAVIDAQADVGLALDGDADRVLAVDERGEIVDGDQLLAMLAIDRQARGRLPGDAIVATVMSNFGLRRGLDPYGISVVECPVGDRSVLAAMDEHGLELGGEQSGHLVNTDLATTGDGTLSGILLLDVMARTGRPLSDLASVVTRAPQVLRAVRSSNPAAASDAAMEVVRAVEAELGDEGRVLVRPSGTEPVVRVMVEATELERAEQLADRVVAAVDAAARP